MTTRLPPLVILAGGQSTRMKGFDKATVVLGGKRMIDIVIDRFRGRASLIVVAGGSNRDTGLPLVEDDASGPKGPAGALWSAMTLFSEQDADVRSFFTVPTDTPFLPADLLDRLSADGDTAIASDEAGLHPTIGHWRIEPLRLAFAELGCRGGPPLHKIAERCKARHVPFTPEDVFNINTPEDLAAAEHVLGRKKVD